MPLPEGLLATVFKAGGKQVLEEYRRAKLEEARSILVRKIAKGKPWAITDDAAAAALFTYLRAAEEGAARRNLELMAEAFANAAIEATFAPDEFRRHARMLADLSREEVIILAAFVRAHREIVNQSEALGEEFQVTAETWRRVKEEMCGAGRFLPDPDSLVQHVGALQRTGLIAAHSAFGGLIYSGTPMLHVVERMVDFEAAAASEDTPMD